MNPARIVYEDAPAYIPVPTELQHCRVETIFWPLGNRVDSPAAPPQATLPLLGEFREKLPKQSESAAEFCRAMRDGDRY